MLPAKALKDTLHYPFTWNLLSEQPGTTAAASPALLSSTGAPATRSYTAQWFGDSYLVVENIFCGVDTAAADPALLGTSVASNPALGLLIQIKRLRDTFRFMTRPLPTGHVTAVPEGQTFGLPVPLLIQPKEMFEVTLQLVTDLSALNVPVYGLCDFHGTRVFT